MKKKIALFVGLLVVLFIANAGAVFAAPDDGVFSYICVYNKNESGWFLDSQPFDFLKTEGFSHNKTTYSFQTKDNEIVIHAYLTIDAIFDSKHKYAVQVNGAKQAKSYPVKDGENVFTVDVLDGTKKLAAYTLKMNRTNAAPALPAPKGPVLGSITVQPGPNTMYVNIAKQFDEANGDAGADNYQVQFKAYAAGQTSASLTKAESAADDSTWKTPKWKSGKPNAYGNAANPLFRWSIVYKDDTKDIDNGVVIRARIQDKKGWGPWLYSFAPNGKGWDK
ncbi:MAG: hypothetical protein LBT01_01790 [Spirochaetaceae bacterium]|jgi:hypothetical protein|nr:hypothetical protein [Spirochaetaceae bacterium]